MTIILENVILLARIFHRGRYVPRPAGFQQEKSGGVAAFSSLRESHDESSFELVKKLGFWRLLRTLFQERQRRSVIG